MMRVRYEQFGGIISLKKPPSLVYVDRKCMKGIGYRGSPLWDIDSTHLSAPVTVHFAVTNRCPAGCSICYSSSTYKTNAEIPTIEARAILKMLAEMGVFTVAFGGGEPLARADIFELAEYAKLLGLTPTMTTNGFLVNEGNARLCRVFEHIHISLDGIGNMYRSVRGVDGFDKVDRAIRLLRKNGIKVGVNCVVSRINFNHLEELVVYLKNVGLRNILFLRLKPFGRALADYQGLKLTPSQAREFYPRFAELTRRYKLQSYVDCSMLPFIYYHRPDKKKLAFSGGDGCNGGDEIVEISPDGQLRACSFISESAGCAVHLKNLWDSSSCFKRYRDWKSCAPEPCLSCDYLDLCKGGCHAVAQMITGDFYAPDPECPYVVDGGA